MRKVGPSGWEAFSFLYGQLLDSALKISLEVNDSVYDAAYHALAISLDATFITLDRKYYKKASRLGFIEYLGQ